jgi:hypothetical protein
MTRPQLLALIQSAIYREQSQKFGELETRNLRGADLTVECQPNWKRDRSLHP